VAKIANYSTTVTAMKSIGEIQGILVAHGAKHILMDYDKGEPTGMAFVAATPYGDMPFRLPARIDRVQAVLEKQRVRSEVSRDLASRVAWRILKDWVRAQMAILETEMVSIEQVFLSYAVVKDDKTLYEALVENKFKMLTGGEKDVGTNT